MHDTTKKTQQNIHASFVDVCLKGTLQMLAHQVLDPPGPVQFRSKLLSYGMKRLHSSLLKIKRYLWDGST